MTNHVASINIADNVFLGRDFTQLQDYSDGTAEEIETFCSAGNWVMRLARYIPWAALRRREAGRRRCPAPSRRRPR